jgi:hypothetical protein
MTMLTEKTRLAIEKAAAVYAQAQKVQRKPLYSHDDALKAVGVILHEHPRRFDGMRRRCFEGAAHLPDQARAEVIPKMVCATFLAESSLRRVN